MSYILDALKKSQQQRSDGAGDSALTPLLTTPAVAASVEAHLPLSLVVIVFLAVVGAFGLYFFSAGTGSDFYPDKQTTPVAAKPVESEPVPATEAAVVVAPTDGQSTVALQSTPQVQPQLRPEVVRATDFVPAEVKPVVTLAPEPEPVSESESVTALPAPVVSASSMPRPEAPESQASSSSSSSSIEHRHLPPLSSLRKVPDLIITGHIYSQDSSARTVSMNGREWYEGDLIVPGVFLQTITPTGIVLDVDGYPFSINRNSGWQSIGE